MKHLLNTISLRQLKFVELLFYADEWMTSEQVAQELQCSVRILRDDIAIINKSFYPFHIDTSNKNGVFLTYPEEYSIDYVYEVVLSTSFEFLFLEMIFHDETLSIDQVCEELYISPSTLARIVKKMKKHFLTMNIQLKTGPFRIVGEEQAIRFLFVQFFMEKYTTGNFPTDPKQKQAIETLIKTVGQSDEFPLNFPDMKQLRAMIYTTLIRNKNGHSKLEEVIFSEDEKKINEIVNLAFIQKEFMMSFQMSLTPHLLKEMFSIFLAADFAANPEQFRALASGSNKKAAKIIKHIETFLDKLSDRLQIPLKNREKLLLEVYNIHQFFNGESYILFDKKQQFAYYAEAEYPLLIEVVKEELVAYSQISSFSWNEASFNELLYTLIIHWTDLPEILKTAITPLNIGIFCDYDLEHSKFLIDLINFHFDEHVRVYNFKAITEEEAFAESNSYDLVITNISNFPFQSSQVICVNSVPSMHDWKNIKRRIVATTKGQFLTTKFIEG